MTEEKIAALQDCADTLTTLVTLHRMAAVVTDAASSRGFQMALHKAWGEAERAADYLEELDL